MGVGGAHPGGLQLTKEILSKENVDHTTSILDIGCGTGQTSAYIAEQYKCSVTSIDSSKVMIDKARQRFLSLELPIEVKQGSVENLPFDTDFFDMVLSESVIQFTNGTLAIPELKRILKPNGVLLAIEMVLEKSLPEKDMKSIIDFYGVSPLRTEAEWVSAFQKGGFKQIGVEKYEKKFDGDDVENAADFSLSENIKETYLTIHEQHEHLSYVYKDSLGFRIFRCMI
ncbi:class I SAM-dependent methyltransferase [Virgibacillus sp. NKC19-16]|nr:class I SAM-dependent methyltransferase [Virgibacillus sp. NKC19-16]